MKLKDSMKDNIKDILKYGVLTPRGWYWKKIYQMSVISPQYKPLVFFLEWLFIPLTIIGLKIAVDSGELPWTTKILFAMIGYSLYCNIKIFWYDRIKEKAMAYHREHYLQ